MIIYETVFKADLLWPWDVYVCTCVCVSGQGGVEG